MFDSHPALVLNADFRPLSYFPLSLWSWQETIKAVVSDRVAVVSEYDRLIHSPRLTMRLPSVISLKDYVPTARRPAFTRFNVFLRDRFTCQYCSRPFPTHDLTFDHVIPRSKGGEHHLGQCGYRLLAVQSAQGKPFGARRRDGSVEPTGSAFNL